MEKYIHIRNWDRYQHPDVTRANRAVPWIKDYTGQLNEYDYLELTLRQRGLLHGLRLLYAANRGSGLGSNVAQVGRMLGDTTVRARDIESLNQAGYITLSASRTQAERKHLYVDVDVDGEEPLATESPEEPVDNSEANDLDWIGAVTRAVANGVTKVPAVPSNGHARDLLWDELETLFGSVTSGTNAHAKRNKAVKDLKRLEAEVELVPRAVARWRQLHPNAELTDMALATHYPQLTVGMRAQVPACSECGMGGGLHVSDCSLIPGLLEEDAA